MRSDPKTAIALKKKEKKWRKAAKLGSKEKKTIVEKATKELKDTVSTLKLKV